MVSKCLCDVGDCSHRWGWGPALLPHSLTEMLRGETTGSSTLGRGRTPLRSLFRGFVIPGAGGRSRAVLWDEEWVAVGAWGTGLWDWECPEWLRSAAVPTVSSSCTCVGSGDGPGRGRDSQGPSCVWGKRGGQKDSKEGRGFPGRYLCPWSRHTAAYSWSSISSWRRHRS